MVGCYLMGTRGPQAGCFTSLRLSSSSGVSDPSIRQVMLPQHLCMATVESSRLIAPLSLLKHKPMCPEAKYKSVSSPFWEGLRNSKLRFQSCLKCSTANFPPRRSCSACHSEELEWKDSAGEGTIHSITTVHRAPSRKFKHKVPYDLAIVELDEGFRFMVNVSPPMVGKIGSRLRLTFQEKTDPPFLPEA